MDKPSQRATQEALQGVFRQTELYRQQGGAVSTAQGASQNGGVCTIVHYPC